jgi:hypothetical protein
VGADKFIDPEYMFSQRAIAMKAHLSCANQARYS